MRTATVIFSADSMYEHDAIYLISKIRHIQWQTDDEVVLILGIVCARIALDTIKSKAILRNDMKYIAIPIHQITVSSSAKAQLDFLKCEFGVNVVYPHNASTCTNRSVLFPASLLMSELPDLSHSKYWGYADFLNPQNPVFIEASKEWLELIGMAELKGGPPLLHGRRQDHGRGRPALLQGDPRGRAALWVQHEPRGSRKRSRSAGGCLQERDGAGPRERSQERGLLHPLGRHLSGRLSAIETGLMTIAKNTYPGLETVVFCGFTPQEQAELDGFAARVA